MPVADNVMRLLARYSEGLRLAVEHGPSSGTLFEYALQNMPQGSGALGRWIDRTFLHLSTWDSIRQRISTTKDLVRQVLEQRRTAGERTMVLDVACGTGRSLRELAREKGGDDLVIACHDRDPRLVMHGRQLAAAEGLKRFTFSVGDATDASSYLTSQDPDIVLAVGLFPYLYSDEAVRTVMRLVFAHLSEKGCFICTTLAAPHARLPHWEADPFVPNPAIRSADTIAAWLRATGFERIDQCFSQPDGFALIGWKLSQS